MFRLLPAVVIGPLLAACGGAQSADQLRMEAMERRMGVLDEAFLAQERRIEQLKDQIALLEDRQEASQLQAGLPADRALPIVKLRPAEVPPPAEAAPETAEPPVVADARPPVTITQADLDALGGGPADDAEGPRRFPRQPVAPPENAAFAGNIGVAPLQGAPRVAPRPVSRAPAAALGGADDPIAAYKRAYGLYRAGQGGAAESAFAAFVERFGAHDYADNALFWIGQVQFDEARFGAALATFHRVITEHPTGNKVPDALLMIGLTQAKLGRGAEGRETLARLRAMYPQTEAARKADDRLQPGKM